MARSCREERWEPEQGFNSKEDELKEEALSFCDLPVKEKQFLNEKPRAIETEDDEFDFNLWAGNSNSSQPPPPMCAADDVFFQGQMLPLRLSFSSENGNNFSRNLSIRSESMDHNMLRFRNTSSSSRSSSSRSHYSRSSSISNNSISIPTSSKPRAQNLFHSHPSPKPQIRSYSTSGRQGSTGRQSRSSSRWDFFRLGLLRTPGMELQDLKNRSNNNNNNNILCETTKALVPKNGKPITGKFGTTTDMTRQKTSGLLGVVSCKRSVETVATPKMTAKSSSSSRSSSRSSNKTNESGKAHGIGEKVMVELKMMKKQKQKMIETQKQKQKQKHQNEGEQTLSHRRTFEWLKQLSHASFADEP